MSTNDDSDRILVARGLVLQWQGPSLYESQQDLDTRDTTGITPGDGTKTLKLLRQLSAESLDDGRVWLCETSNGDGQPVRVVLKLFSPALWDQPDLGYYASHGWTPEILWRKFPGPE